ncbi:AraC family transcriptional regulator [uncultured Mitsuokella sp.]|uniref:helix-turn-helix transcriptional regulator n=1 Tax=uncultured Mitsuokella sp. TaxID=453120 RepID=UPI002670B0CA|nr:AraC family transcriptional regulator [uncultured Mitsuokella sp.]
MLQYFIPRTNGPHSAQDSSCHLRSVCDIDSRHGKLPRTMHMHTDRAEIILVTAGHGSFNIDTGHYLAGKGDILFFDSGILHDETTVEGDLATSCLSVSDFKRTKRRPNAMVGDCYAPLLHLGDSFPEIYALFQALTKMARTGNPVSLLDALTAVILDKLDFELRRYGQKPQQQEESLGLTVKAYIDRHYREEITLKSIAEDLNFNPYYLAHAFKEHIGYSPMQYIIRRRIGEAQNLLISTDRSITDIALSCGYNNSNYFQSVFKNLMGMTPGQYRRDWVKNTSPPKE